MAPCASCSRPVNVRMAVCPFCGRRRDDAPPRPVVTKEAAAAAAKAEKLAAVVAVARSASPGAVGAGPGVVAGLPELRAPRCPLCEGAPGAEPLAVEVWVDEGIHGFFRRYRRWRITRVRAPGVCDDCRPALRNRRLLAGALTMVPWLLGLLHLVLFAFVALFYGGYLLRRLSYTWADDILYGRRLAETALTYIPGLPRELRMEGDPRIPVGWLHWFARAGMVVVVALATFVVAAALHSSK